jgi:hypothetical protein
VQVAADAVVFLTGIPIAGVLILDGLSAHHQGEVMAGVVVALLLGGPSVVLSIRARLRARATGRERAID